MSKAAALRRVLFSRRSLAIVSGGTLVAAGGGYWYLNSGPTYPPSTKETRRPPPPWTPPSRQNMLDALKASDVKQGNEYTEEFDLLIVGGGATGAGVALDAASRGLKVALVERDDFSSGESPSIYHLLLRCFWNPGRASPLSHHSLGWPLNKASTLWAAMVFTLSGRSQLPSAASPPARTASLSTVDPSIILDVFTGFLSIMLSH